jgi:periplasmic protein CpxP/Spy
MSRQRLLSIAVIVLLLLNVATLAVLLLRKPQHPHHPAHGGPKTIIIGRLQFDTDQVSRYEELIRGHRQRIHELDDRMIDLRRQLYGADATRKDSLIQLIGATQSDVERVHTAHFADIRAICRPDQLPRYDELTKDLADYFRHGPPPPGAER